MTADEIDGYHPGLFSDENTPTVAAVRYARHGMSVFPVDMRRGDDGQPRKTPLYGYLWKQRATSNLHDIVEDFTDAEHDIGIDHVGVAWAVGLDGKVALDLDHEAPDWWPQVKSTAVNVTSRGEHLIFEQPPGRRVGNGTSRFPSSGWGECRGVGGYVVIWWPGDRPGFDVADLGKVAAFPHPEWLTDADVDAEAVTFAALEEFKAEHTAGHVGRIKGFGTRLGEWEPGISRHDHAHTVACWIAREAAAGLVPAREAFDALEQWCASVATAKRRRFGLREVRASECWAIGQLTVERVEEVRAKAAAEVDAWRAEQRVEEARMFGQGSSPLAAPVPEAIDVDHQRLIDPASGEAVPERLADAVRRQVEFIEVQDIARRIATEATFVPPPEPRSLRWLLDHPPPVTKSRIERVLARDGRALLVAPRKIGKTTVIVNVLRSLSTGAQLFNTWDVDPCQVHVLNYEVTGWQFSQWCDAAGVDEGVLVSNLRGVPNPLASLRARQELVRQIRDGGSEVLIVDPYSAASGAMVDGEGNNAAIRGWLSMLDEMATDAGCSEVILAVHGSFKALDPDAARGGTALEDWPDVIWRLSADEHGERFFAAVGRDVDVPQDRLTFNPENRRLSFGMQRVSKAGAKEERFRREATAILRTQPGVQAGELKEAVRRALPQGYGSDTLVNDYLKAMEADGLLVRQQEKQGLPAHHYLPGAEPADADQDPNP